MKFLLSLGFVFIFHAGFSQSTDSIALLINQYNYQGALKKLEKINPDSLNTLQLYQKGMALKALSRYNEAIDWLERSYFNDSTNIKVLIELAECFKTVSNYEKPGDLYKKALLIYPDNKYLMLQSAGYFISIEKYDLAKYYYLKACANDTNTFLLKQIGLCYEKIHRTDSAIYCYKKAILYDPSDYQPVFRLANLYKNMLQINNGIALTDTFLLHGNVSKDITRLSGYLHYLDKAFDKAIDRFETSVELGDTSIFVSKYLGYSYFKINDFPNTIKNLEKVFKVDSSDAEMSYALALAHDTPQNIRYFNTAINIMSPAIPIMTDLFRDLSLALTKNHQYDDALAALLKAYELTPTDPSLLYKIALHYDNWMDDKQAALKYYSNFMKSRTDPDSPFIITGTSVIDQEDFRHAEMRIKDLEKKSPSLVLSTDSIN